MPLTDADLAAAVAGLHGWSPEADAIRRTFNFADFAAAMRFVNRVAEVAEAAGHHPDIEIRWNRVTLTLSTHSEDGVTQRDIDLARQVEAIA